MYISIRILSLFLSKNTSFPYVQRLPIYTKNRELRFDAGGIGTCCASVHRNFLGRLSAAKSDGRLMLIKFN